MGTKFMPWSMQKYGDAISILQGTLACPIADNDIALDNDYEGLDFSGYDVTYGFINGDGYLMAMFVPQEANFIDSCEKEAVKEALEEWLDSCDDPVKKVQTGF